MPANLGEAQYRLTINSKDFDKGIDQAKTGTRSLKDSLTGLTSILTTGVVASLAAAGRAAIESHAKFQKFNAQFTALLKSKEIAADFVDELQRFSAASPLAFEPLAQAAITLRGFELQTKEIIPVLKNLSNASMGNAEVLGRLAKVYGQVRAAGKAMTEDLNQTIDAGVPIMSAIADVLGVATGEVKKLASESKVTAEVYEEAIRRITTGNGLLAGSIDAMADTLEGKMNELKGNLDLLLADIGKAFERNAEDAIAWGNTLIEQAGKVVDSFVALRDSSNEALFGVANLQVELLKVAAVLQVLGLPQPIQDFLTGGALGPVTQDNIARLTQHFDELRDAMAGVGVGEYLQSLREVPQASEEATNATETLTESIWDQLHPLEALSLAHQRRIESERAAAAEAEQIRQNYINGYGLMATTRIESDQQVEASEQAYLARSQAAYAQYYQSRIDGINMVGDATKEANDKAAREAEIAARMAEASAWSSAESIAASFRQMGSMATGVYRQTAAAARKSSGEQKDELVELANTQYEVALAFWLFNKAASATMAAIKTAEAYVSALAVPPAPNFLLAGLAAAAGAIQVGLILAQPPPPPPRLAEGGIVTKPTYALIGEAGPEAVLPLKGNMPAMMGGTKIVVTGNQILGGTEEDLAVRLDQALRKRGQY